MSHSFIFGRTPFQVEMLGTSLVILVVAVLSIYALYRWKHRRFFRLAAKIPPIAASGYNPVFGHLLNHVGADDKGLGNKFSNLIASKNISDWLQRPSESSERISLLVRRPEENGLDPCCLS